MEESFSTVVTTKTIKSDYTIVKLNPISEAIKNAIDAKATRINIYFEEVDKKAVIFIIRIFLLLSKTMALVLIVLISNICKKGGDYIKNTLGGKSRGRYSYLKFIDFKDEYLSNIKIYTKYNNKNYSVVFSSNKNIEFKVEEEETNHENTTKVYIKRLEDSFINNNTIKELIEKTKKEIIVEFADKLLKGITLIINNEEIKVKEYIEKQLKKEYKLKNDEKIKAYMVVWNKEIDLAMDKKHVFLFNTDGIFLDKLPSGCQKSIWNCHTVYLTSSCFKEDCELIYMNPDYKKVIDEAKNLYKRDLNRLLFEVWLENVDLIANKLTEKSDFFNNEVDEMIQEKIKKAYTILSLPLLIKQHHINNKNASYFSNSLIGLISDNSYNTLGNLNFVFNLEKEDQEIFNYVRENVNILNLIKKYHNYLSRLDFLQHFENLVLNEGKAETKERKELHKIVENNLWLFDEEYLNLDFFSDQSLKGIFNEIKLPTNNIDSEDKLNVIPDIFIPRTKDNELILIELKAPKVKINANLLTEVFNKYVVKILDSLSKQGSNIKRVKAICISSEKEQPIPNFIGDNYNIEPMTWKEIISKRKEEFKNHIKDIKSSLSLSKYKDIHDFREKEIKRERVNNLKKI